MKILRLLVFMALIAGLILSQQSGLCIDEILSDEEVTSLLRELLNSQNANAEFLILPDGYEIPQSGIDGIYNLLLIGVDTNSPDLRGRSDTMILASLNLKTGRLKLISFMRDLYVSIPGHGHNKLNASYSYGSLKGGAIGGATLLLRTLQNNFGVTADGYVAVNFSLMADLVDAIGGIEIFVKDTEIKPLNGILEYYNYVNGFPEQEGRLRNPGMQLLTGKQTMSYSRIRKLDSDFSRVERQRRVICAIYKKMLTMGITDLTRIALSYSQRVGTNIAMADALDLLADAVTCDTITVDEMRVPIDGGYSSKMLNDSYYIVPNYNKNIEKIKMFLAN